MRLVSLLQPVQNNLLARFLPLNQCQLSKTKTLLMYLLTILWIIYTLYKTEKQFVILLYDFQSSRIHLHQRWRNGAVPITSFVVNVFMGGKTDEPCANLHSRLKVINLLWPNICIIRRMQRLFDHISSVRQPNQLS